ncbi:MAG: hypothetical protein ACFFA8_07660 [Promethearchaeota archaeon]
MIQKSKSFLRARERESFSDKSMFNITDFSFREFQTFLILLKHEGKDLSTLKKLIDLEFGYKSRTKGYDYINSLCSKGMAYKKVTLKKSKKEIKICIDEQIRKNYEHFIMPTIKDVNKAIKNLYHDNIVQLKDLEIIQDKFKSYTEILIDAIQNLLKKTTLPAIKSERFQSTISNLIWKYFKAEMLKYEMFSI